ncbi:hypothetical protein CALVIDRAFT_186839 [Calocera viscosa TUFC12733]|uniref:Uncharacterized protein n=1 Tax=Calocera viscosa (strain TUFC12733) TaxID=1330018 RepID=A0A167KU53_CALVF|nr:hypothetical protein CALVIDRAFT_186839 [Calocera viscosa TUFC12733]
MRACLVFLSVAASALSASIPRHHPHHPQPSGWASVVHDSDGSSSSGSSGGDAVIPIAVLPPLRPLDLPSTNAERLRRGLPLKAPTRVLKARQAEISTVITIPSLELEPTLAEKKKKKVLLGKREELPLIPPAPQKMEGYIALSLWPDDRTLGYLACASECAVLPPTAVSRATVFNFSPGHAAGEERFGISFEQGVLGGTIKDEDTTNIALSPISPSSADPAVQSHLFTYDPSTSALAPHWEGLELALSAYEGGLRLTSDIEGLRDERYRKGGKGAGPLMMSFIPVMHHEW